MNRLGPRALFGAIFVACVGLLAFASYLQHVKDLEPCPMCILQRYAFFGVGIVALVGAIHGPGVAGTRVYAGLLALFALAGLGTAARHSYLQRFPDPSTSCGVELDYLVNNFPLAQALPKIFAGSGECAKVKWRMLGLSIPEWALVWFLAIIVIALWIAFRRRRA
jgi:protein dithiol:quinone oxidoreductase